MFLFGKSKNTIIEYFSFTLVLFPSFVDCNNCFAKHTCTVKVPTCIVMPSDTLTPTNATYFK